MIKVKSPIITQNSEILYKTINYRNHKIPFTCQNKALSQKISSELFSLTLKKKNSDEDDTKNNQNFKIFMNDLFKKDKDNNEISSIHSNQIFLGKEKNNYNIMNYNYKQNYNYNFKTSKYQKNKKYLSKENNIIENNSYNNEELKNNETEKRSIGSECNIINIFNEKRNRISRNYLLRKENSIFGNNTAKNIQTFSFQEFDGKMLNKAREKNYIKKVYKISKRNKNINSFNSIRRIIPKNLIPKLMFQSRNLIKKEKEIKIKLLTMKENAILFLKDKGNINSNKNFEKNNLINSYGYTNEKKDLTLNKKSKNNLKNFPLIKLKIFYNDKYNKNINKLEIKDRNMKLVDIKMKNTYSDNEKLIYSHNIQ